MSCQVAASALEARASAAVRAAHPANFPPSLTDYLRQALRRWREADEQRPGRFCTLVVGSDSFVRFVQAELRQYQEEQRHFHSQHPSQKRISLTGIVPNEIGDKEMMSLGRRLRRVRTRVSARMGLSPHQPSSRSGSGRREKSAPARCQRSSRGASPATPVQEGTPADAAGRPWGRLALRKPPRLCVPNSPVPSFSSTPSELSASPSSHEAMTLKIPSGRAVRAVVSDDDDENDDDAIPVLATNVWLK